MGLGEGWGVMWGKDTYSRGRMIVERLGAGHLTFEVWMISKTNYPTY